jgi:hypothetical protein
MSADWRKAQALYFVGSQIYLPVWSMNKTTSCAASPPWRKTLTGATRALAQLLGSSGLTPDDQRALFSNAGYVDVQNFRRTQEGLDLCHRQKAGGPYVRRGRAEAFAAHLLLHTLSARRLN